MKLKCQAVLLFVLTFLLSCSISTDSNNELEKEHFNFILYDRLTPMNIIVISEKLENNHKRIIHLTYCIINGCNTGLSAVYCNNSNPLITHCTIENNFATSYGAIYLYNSNSPISHCTIKNNISTTYACGINIVNSTSEISYCDIIGNENINSTGGGIYCALSTAYISYCNITGNAALNGGGIYAGTGSSLTIRSSMIDHNDASFEGGGIFISSSTGVFTLTSCMILANTSATGGSGIHIVDADSVVITTGSLFDHNTSWNIYDYVNAAIYSINCAQLIIDHCDFVKNVSGWDLFAAGITLDGNTNLTLTNSIFRGQDGTDIDFHNYLSASISYCDFLNSFMPFNLPPSGLGILTTVNANGDSCDVFYNIYLDPLFVDYTNGDYHLTENSPCIDAGDPNFPLDPDNTISDMGAWYFHQSPLIVASDSLLDFGIVDIGQQLDLPLTIRNDGRVALHLQNVSNQNSVFTHDWNPADSLILPNDSLIIAVTFMLVDTNLIVDTLLIENNDKPLQVGLSGKGKTVVGIEDQSELPKVYALYPAYPNPFNPTTNIEFSIPKSELVTLKIYNILGEEVATLVSERLPAGQYKYDWDAGSLASGVYLYRIQAGDYVGVKKVVLMK